MPTIEAVYQEIAGNAPDRESVARIRRAGRLLNLTETDSGWLLLAVLAAHGSLAQADLQSAATLAASLSITADEAKTTAGTVTRATDTAVAAITQATDGVKSALVGALENAVRHVAAQIGSRQKSLAETIENIVSSTAGELVTRVGAAGRKAEEAIAAATGVAAKNFGSTVDNSTRKAVSDITNGAKGARDRIIADWKAAVVAAVNTEFSTRARIDTEKARRRTIWAALLASALVAILTAGVGYGAHQIGWQDGMQYGVGRILTGFPDQDAGASWTNTPDGKLAYQLYRAGSIHALATCDQPGWKVEPKNDGLLCVPNAMKDGSLYGWLLH